MKDENCPDSWELLSWDASNIAQALEDNGFPEDIAERIRSLVRRAKALAGVIE